MQASDESVPSKLDEKIIVKSIREFLKFYSSSMKKWNDEALTSKIKKYVEEVSNEQGIFSENAKKLLESSLAIQALAYRSREIPHSRRLTTDSDSALIFIPDPYYTCIIGVGLSSDADGDAGMVVFGIGIVCSVVAATYGVLKDTYESIVEIARRQSVLSNLASLSFTGACIAGAYVAIGSILASNPIGWGLLGSAAIVLGTALLIKAARYIFSQVDASLTSKSGLETDSRFYLSGSDFAKLKAKGFDDEGIEKIREVIRGLAVDAANTKKRVGVFGTKDEYQAIINLLTDVKKGEIPPKIAKQYGIKKPEPPQETEFTPLPNPN